MPPGCCERAALSASVPRPARRKLQPQPPRRTAAGAAGDRAVHARAVVLVLDLAVAADARPGGVADLPARSAQRGPLAGDPRPLLGDNGPDLALVPAATPARAQQCARGAPPLASEALSDERTSAPPVDAVPLGADVADDGWLLASALLIHGPDAVHAAAEDRECDLGDPTMSTRTSA